MDCSAVHCWHHTPETTPIETALLEWLDAHRQYALALVPLFAFAEACVGIGLFVSGLFLATVASWLYTTGTASLLQILPLAFGGALLGDHAGFFAGRWLGPGIHQLQFVQQRAHILQRAEAMIRQYGAFTVFIGRLVPAIRSLVPALLGVSGFHRRRFILLDIAACLVWAAGLGVILMGVDNLL